ncbi:unnamed protein product (macronuclear) [Paramecium tetraurelia]|uniref:ABC transporter domain-containing protein n=1 Tax=Paramecium tetraurelia TaxID=5888 RepID=A0BMH5_PARTE|nr:uncharacterized protein GSPATT00030378001 [Paramecium tetraurelia]CAK59742.1 unnamed protein product [Paramecium tetraurelia]|eukprot:XP_001427140.1 hypothetical protein (macronuclear) [Paramecium tetraurelia strain d4-2]
MQFYHPDQGYITINGVDITQYDIRTGVFKGTITENIQLNLPSEQIENASKLAKAYDFIISNQFEKTQITQKGTDKQRGQGFQRQVGPKGTQISGGQKQRIILARAILRNHNILLLDEAKSTLDTTSEHLVQDSINKLMQSKTTIAIAHRISTIQVFCFESKYRIQMLFMF